MWTPYTDYRDRTKAVRYLAAAVEGLTRELRLQRTGEAEALVGQLKQPTEDVEAALKLYQTERK